MRKAINIAHEYLKSVEIEFDKENNSYASKLLQNVKEIIVSLNDEYLNLEFEILECRALQKNEKVTEAKKLYENLCLRYSNDPRPLLYLAEIYLISSEIDKNKDLLEKAEKINGDYWLLKFEKLVRAANIDQNIDLNRIDEESFPEDKRTRSAFYRVYANLLRNSGNISKAVSFIEKAIYLNPNRLSSYLTKLSLIENEVFDSNPDHEIKNHQKVLDEIKKIEDVFYRDQGVSARNVAHLNISKLNVYFIQEKYQMYGELCKTTFDLLVTCYFDSHIDQMLSIVLIRFKLPNGDLDKLIEYLSAFPNSISDNLSKSIMLQFIWENELLTKGLVFYKNKNKTTFFTLIENIRSNKFKDVYNFIISDLHFTVNLINSLNGYSELRTFLIDNLPDDSRIQKDTLLLLMNYDKKDYDQALAILNRLDLSKLSYAECNIALRIAGNKRAWDLKQIILKKLIHLEKDDKILWQLKFELFEAFSNQKQYLEIIKLGNDLLNISYSKGLLNDTNKEMLLGQVISAHLERGEFKEAKILLETYPLEKPSFEFKIAIEAEVYLQNKDAQKAIISITDAVKIKGKLFPEEYAKLFLPYIRIGNLIDYKVESLAVIKDNTFVKLREQQDWFYLGDGVELDASKIESKDDKYLTLINCKIGDTISFNSKYRSGEKKFVIENILPLDKYILWQSSYHFRKLSEEERWAGARIIDIPSVNGQIDPKYLLGFLEDMSNRKKPFFELYLKNNMPLAALAVNEGGIANAIGKIQQEKMGFVNFSDGSIQEAEKQKSILKLILEEKRPFYIDATSAIFLAESGYLNKIYKHIPNVKIPQSVINFLISVKNNFVKQPGHVTTMGYAQGKIIVSSLDSDNREVVLLNFNKSIELLESIPENITAISSANKVDCFSERDVPDELCDACILAQRDKSAVLTEDPLYLVVNSLQTKKEIPKYISSLFLIKVLYEQKKISFLEYVDFFGYLSSYRFRFLPITSEDIEKTVLGDGQIKIIKPENIGKLNLALTLSEEYGVTFQNAFSVIAWFIYKMIADDTLSTEIVEKIFIETIEAFPKKTNKRLLSGMILKTCQIISDKEKTEWLIRAKNTLFANKIDKLLKATEIWKMTDQLWVPKGNK